MKLLMTSIILAGAGSLAVHAENNIESKAKEPLPIEKNSSKEFVFPSRALDTFIIAPNNTCTVSSEQINFVQQCINIDKIWLKAI